MTTPWRPATGEFDPARDADRIGDAWDALVAGHRPLAPDLVADDTAELIALAGQLTTEAAHGPSRPRPTPIFRTSLRETLMHTGTIPLTTIAAQSLPALDPLPKLGRPVAIGLSRDALTAPSWVRRAGVRWAGIAATIALLVGSLGAGYLADRGPSESGPTRAPGFAASTPEASPATANTYVDGCAAFRPYAPCGSDGIIGRGLATGYVFAPELLEHTLVTMQGWEIPAGNTVTYEPDPNRLSGIGVDFVLEGAYMATFSGPVIVQRRGVMGSSVEYPPAGELVELGYGDTVSYNLTTRVSIVNPLATRPLRFKSIVVHEEPAVDTGGPAGAQPVEGNPGGGDVRITDDGTGRLPKPISQYPNQELGLVLMYIQVDPTAPFPPAQGPASLILGPVDPVQPEIEEGYILWAFESRG